MCDLIRSTTLLFLRSAQKLGKNQGQKKKNYQIYSTFLKYGLFKIL